LPSVGGANEHSRMKEETGKLKVRRNTTTTTNNAMLVSKTSCSLKTLLYALPYWFLPLPCVISQTGTNVTPWHSLIGWITETQ
jgi:hypothetical protein